jgi:hypothetical protein
LKNDRSAENQRKQQAIEGAAKNMKKAFSYIRDEEIAAGNQLKIGEGSRLSGIVGLSSVSVVANSLRLRSFKAADA